MPNCGETETAFHKEPFRYSHPKDSPQTCKNCWYWKDTDKTRGINSKAVCITEGTCPYRKPARTPQRRYTLTSGDGSGGR